MYLNVLGLEGLTRNKILHLKYYINENFKSSKFYVFSGIKLLDANSEFYVIGFISCDLPSATRRFPRLFLF